MKIYKLKIVYEAVNNTPSTLMNKAPDFLDYMKDAFAERPLQEAVYVLPLNSKNQPLGRYMATLGIANASLAHPREIFQPIILSGASAFIVCHNHPSGDPSPSKQDIQFTRILREASKVMCIDMLDHIIIGNHSADPSGQGYYSFNESGFLHASFSKSHQPEVITS